ACEIGGLDVIQATQQGDIHARVVVIGGGISGLAAALRLRMLLPDVTITVVESTANLGGKIVGEIAEGCVIDGGADVCIGDKLRTTHLFDSLDLASHVIRANPNGLPTYELRDGYLQRLPTSFPGELLTFPGGVRELVERACAALNDIEVLRSTRAETVESEGGKWRVRIVGATSLIADAVVVATPASAAASLVPAIAAELASTLCSLEYPLTTTVTMAWRRADVLHPLNATGYLVAAADAPVSACTFTSAKNPSHAPEGIALVRCYIRHDVEDPVELMRQEVESVLGISAPPQFVRFYRWSSGIPLYTAAHAAAVRTLETQIQSTPGVFVAGSAFHGVGIPDCIQSGESAAERVVSYLVARPTEAAA
ncbi:MAG: FAD-dependent oxidoreductase, partial [Gemmatimonadaceae bacterium]